MPACGPPDARRPTWPRPPVERPAPSRGGGSSLVADCGRSVSTVLSGTDRGTAARPLGHRARPLRGPGTLPASLADRLVNACGRISAAPAPTSRLCSTRRCDHLTGSPLAARTVGGDSFTARPRSATCAYLSHHGRRDQSGHRRCGSSAGGHSSGSRTRCEQLYDPKVADTRRRTACDPWPRCATHRAVDTNSTRSRARCPSRCITTSGPAWAVERRRAEHASGGARPGIASAGTGRRPNTARGAPDQHAVPARSRAYSPPSDPAQPALCASSTTSPCGARPRSSSSAGRPSADRWLGALPSSTNGWDSRDAARLARRARQAWGRPQECCTPNAGHRAVLASPAPVTLRRYPTPTALVRPLLA